ncbi:ecdysteroid-regulated 16 kDa protein-like [Pomacea canaliculata]|uniref:ecdysteroid-regulated 16 kDa protein-like n=1 Tax=Pomacea canaliculata TaxID=400727 RepID=UPI000D739BCB|nr:ecdysteroid-regulated 16 kDa protein-like [Pomacea canaliculata]
MLTHWVQITTTDLVQPQQWSDLRSKQQPGSNPFIHRKVKAFDHRQNCPLTYKDCGSGLSTLVDALYNGTECPSQGDPAVLPRGSTVQLYVDFIPKVSTPNLKASIHAIIAKIPVPFPGAPTDACQGANITCPVKSGVQYTYAPVFPIKNDYPSIATLVKWELQDESGKDIVCLVFPVEIK